MDVASCLTCRRRKIRCSGEQPGRRILSTISQEHIDLWTFAVCKTCSDYKHVCLGYSESTAHLRSQSDSASRMPPVPPFAGRNDPSHRIARAVESCSPEPRPPPLPTTKTVPENPTQGSKQTENREGSSRDTSARTHREADSQAPGDSPESSKLGLFGIDPPSCGGLMIAILTMSASLPGRTSVSSSNRTHVPYFRYFGPTAIVPGFKQMV